jgi:hypothetical protein
MNSATKGTIQHSWKHSANEARTLFHNSRPIELAWERRHGARQQLVGGGLRMCRFWLPIFHGNRLVRASGTGAVDAVEQANTLAASNV